MRIIGNSDLGFPNVCTLCEEKPDGDTVLDVERYTPEHPTYPLNGRKYICERCVHDIARLGGAEDELTIARTFEDEARRFLASARNQLGFLSRTLTYEQVFGSAPPVERKTKPKAKVDNGSTGA